MVHSDGSVTNVEAVADILDPRRRELSADESKKLRILNRMANINGRNKLTQFVAVAAAAPFVLMMRELISDWYTHGTIPHVHPKAA
jgi:hypothetical protein